MKVVVKGSRLQSAHTECTALNFLNAQSVPDAITLRDLAVSVLDDAKGEDIQHIDLRDRSSFADFMIIASGTSTRQVKAMADRLVQRAKSLGVQPLGVEGDREAEWVLVDLADVVVHLMLPQTRAFYNLEKLWSAPPASQTAQV
ncbi:MAG: ribosome silencing factor [Pseudomonadota bacterium]